MVLQIRIPIHGLGHSKDQVKLTHVSIANFSLMVTGEILILESHRKSCIGIQFAYLHFTLAHSNKVHAKVMHIVISNKL